jgi:thiamine monophosphate synthase
MHKTLPQLFVFIDKYNSKIFRNKNINIGIIYRNYEAKDREKELTKIAKASKNSRYKLFVSNDIKLALKYKADGFYIPSFNKKKKYSNLEKKNMIILGSAHNQKEIHEKINQKCNGIFLSPLFVSAKAKSFLGLNRFNYISNSNKVIFFALGGITEKNAKKLKLLFIKGFGGISMFKKKTGPLGPVL